MIAADRTWLGLSIFLVVGGILTQLIVAKVIRKQWKHVFFALLQLDEAMMVQYEPEAETRKYLAADDIAQAFFSGMQALLVLYALLYWIAVQTVGEVDDLPAKCIPDKTSDFFKIYIGVLVKVVGGIYSVAHGLHFVAQYTGHTSFHLNGYSAAGNGIKYIWEWLKFDLPLTLFLCFNIASHVLGYALLGAITNGWAVLVLVFGKMAAEFLLIFFVVYGGSSGTSMARRLFHSCWKASVSCIASVPWKDPKRTNDDGADRRPAWVFGISLVCSWVLLFVEAIAVITAELVRPSIDEAEHNNWPGDSGVGWILLAFVIAQPLFLWPACHIAAKRNAALAAERASELQDGVKV